MVSVRKKSYKSVFIALVFALLLSVSFLFNPNVIQAQGLVPCQGLDCTLCHFADLANNIIKVLFGMVSLVFVVMMVIAGFGLVTSRGNPAALSDAKSKLVNALIGLLIMLSAWLLVDTLMRALLRGGTNEIAIAGWGPWFEIQCLPQTQTERHDGGDITVVPPVTLPPIVVPPQPDGQICYPGDGSQPVCFPAVTGIAGQPGYQYPADFAVPPRWVDTQDPSVNINRKISRNYTLAQLNRSTACGSGGRFVYIDPRALAGLEQVNSILGVRVAINSAHRSPGCNSAIPNSATRSMHMSGKAFDIAVPQGRTRQDVINACISAGAFFTMAYTGTNHIHCHWR